MRRISVLAISGLFGFCLVNCGSNSSDLTPQSACNEAMAALCNWANKCAGTAGLSAIDPSYTSVAACTSGMQTAECQGSAAACDPGTTFHADKAQQCIDGFNSMACPTSATSTPAEPAACSQVCQ